jgi:hypothetical protein
MNKLERQLDKSSTALAFIEEAQRNRESRLNLSGLGLTELPEVIGVLSHLHTFIASDYCYEVEMNKALERHLKKEARVILVVVRDVRWRIPPLAKLQALPTNAKPVTRWSNREAAWRDVSEGIERVVKTIRKAKARNRH